MNKARQVITLFLILLFSNSSFGQEWENIYNKAWEVLSDKERAFSTFSKARKIAKENNTMDGVIYCDQGLLYVSGYHYDLAQLQKDLAILKEDLKAIEDKDLYSYGNSIYLLENINYNYKLGDYKTAQSYIDSLKYFLENTNTESVTSSKEEFYSSIAQYEASIYKHQGQFEQARETYRRQLKRIEANYTNKNDLLEQQFSLYRMLAQTHAEAGDLEKAISLEKRLLNDDEVRKTMLSQNAGSVLVLSHIRNLIDSKRFKEARDQIDTVDDEKLNNSFQILNLENKARITFHQDNSVKAYAYLDKAIRKAISYRKDSSHADIIKLQLQKAQFLSKENKLPKALTLYKGVLKQLNNNDLPINFINNRLIIKALNGIFSVKEASAFTFATLSSYTNNLISAIDDLQPQFENAVDKQQLIESTFQTLQKNFDLVASHYLKTKSKNALNLCFVISEKYRAIDLRQLSNGDHLEVANKEYSELIGQEKQWVSQINYLQNKSLNTSLKDSLFNLNKAYKKLKEEIQDKIPNYYNAKYGNTIKTLHQGCASLKPDQSILSYFFTSGHLYVFSLHKNRAELTRLHWGEQENQIIENVLQQLDKAQLTKSNSAIKTLSDLLLGSNPFQMTDRVTIVPDGPLHRLPFEILRWKNSLLLDRAAVSYEESVSLVSQNTSKKSDQIILKGFAPFTFNTNNTELINGYAPLNLAKNEFLFSSQKWNSDVLMGSKATLSRFRESVAQLDPTHQNILHIASHAIASTEPEQESYIVFHGADSKLSTSDVYGLSMKNSFVVLSACETGIGEVVTGQGMRSLSQGFRYAGANALLHSKWKVSDRSTSIIMDAFYKELALGASKDIALQQAKITYIKQAPDAKSRQPYFWAGFVLSGDLTAVPVKNNSIFWYLIGGIAVGIVFLFVYKRYQATAAKM